jgi:Gpi18-like mannosyltransferase
MPATSAPPRGWPLRQRGRRDAPSQVVERDLSATESSGTDSDSGEAPSRAAWRQAVLIGGLAWLTSHLAYVIVTLMSWRVGRLSPPQTKNILDTWLRWDTGNYVRIADHGYGVAGQDNAFFPLYPILIRAANFVLPEGSLVAALVVANLAGLGVLIMLYRLTAHEFGGRVAERTVFYLIAFPTAFFLAAGYNASLFLLLVLGALYAMRRENWWLAGWLAALSSATRSAGILLVLPFAYEYLRQRDFKWRSIRPDALAIGLIPTGLILFMIYGYRAFGDALAFSHAQAYWHRQLTMPWVSMWRTYQRASAEALLAEHSIVNTIDLAAAIVFVALLALCVVGPWRFRTDQRYLVIYGGATLIFGMLFAAADALPLISMARLVLEVTPGFMMLGLLGRNRIFDRLYTMPAIALQVLLLAIFLHYDWAD